MKTMVDNAKIARMEKDIKETDAKVKNIKSVPPSTTADAGKVLTVSEDGSISWQQKGAGGGMKAFFDAGGKCGYSKATSFEGIINFSDTSNVTDMSNMFNNCKNILNIPLLDTSKVTNMDQTFKGCSDINSIPLFDTSNVTSMEYMFSSCTHLKEIPSIDVSKVTNMNYMFNYCYELKKISMRNIGANLDINICSFTREALLEIIGNLKTVTTTKTLKIGSTNLAKLTDEDKAIATNKGWSLA